MSTESATEDIAEAEEGPRSRRDSSAGGGDDGAREHESHTRVRVAAWVPADDEGEGWTDPEPEDERWYLVIALAWQRRFAFTNTETRVFHALLMGMPRAVYAARRGVLVKTVDKQAKAIVEKVRRDYDVKHVDDVVGWALQEV